jgi:predicted HAD superfamily Cof-like phosphohydrolase
MNICQDRLVDFHRKFNLDCNNTPTLITDPKVIELRCALIEEEASEFRESSENKDIVGIADAIADLLYVVYGAAVTYGLDTQPIFDEVHRSNMTKVWEDGTAHRRESDGKIIKPPTYSPANIKQVIECLRDGTMRMPIVPVKGGSFR